VKKIVVLYEDENILAVEKPAGILVYYPPHFTQVETTLLDQIAQKLDYPEIGERTGVVHRLDRDTSGIILFAKNTESEIELKRLFKDREIKKQYLALVHGKVTPQKGRITIPLGRAPKDRLKVVPKALGKPSETLYRVQSYFPDKDVSLLEVGLKTGRTHQIRVHLSAIGHPVVGDKLYGRKTDLLSRQFLHAEKMEFIHPFTKKRARLTSALPEDLHNFLESLIR
jgi:23S rRNA pseudouridine1911/1915/1917 synthase